MKQCPYCSSNLHDDAQFCLYCMKNLTDKTVLPPAKKKKTYYYVATAAAALLVVGLIVAMLIINANKKADKNDEDIDNAETFSDTNKNSDTADLPSPEDEEVEIIITPEDFIVYAAASTMKLGHGGLWNPLEMTSIGESALGVAYTAPTEIENADLSIIFLNGGEEVVAAISNLTDQTLEDGVDLTECILAGIQNTTFKNFDKVISGNGLIEHSPVEGENYVVLSGFTDVYAKKADDPKDSITEHMLIKFDDGRYLDYQLRKRVYNGVTYYDMMMLITTE